MQNIELTENLRQTIKKLRKSQKKRSDELSKELGKGASYISQLENGKIKAIDFEILNDIFQKITNLSGKEYDDFLDHLLNNAGSRMTDKELKHEKWMHLFNYQIRMLPIPDSLIFFIKEKLKNLHLTPEGLVEMINKNLELKSSNTIIKETNRLYIDIKNNFDGRYTISTTIKFDLEHDFISRILSKDITTINYINMHGILFNIFLAEGCELETAHKYTDKLLFDNKFYTIQQRNKVIHDTIANKMANNEVFTYYDIQPTDYDKQYIRLRKDILDGFDLASDQDIVYMCDKLEKLSQNMHDDLGFVIAVMSAQLNKISKDNKKAFWDDYQKLIAQYTDKDKPSQLIDDDK